MIGPLLALRLLADPAVPLPADPLPALPLGERVRVDALADALAAIADARDDDDDVRAQWRDLVASHGALDDDDGRREFVRVRLLFESLRDGGLWQLRWAITNREPRSDAIWSQWSSWRGDAPGPDDATATAECDELSALFAHLARRLGVAHVGLFWPVWNHVVAVWTVPGTEGPVRVVVPTSQIFLPDDAGLGTLGFDPSTQARIYDYRRRDVADGASLPRALAEHFVYLSWRYGTASPRWLQQRRNATSARLGGS